MPAFSNYDMWKLRSPDDDRVRYLSDYEEEEQMAYDDKCQECAERLLGPLAKAEEIADLAQAIQDTFDGWMDDRRTQEQQEQDPEADDEPEDDDLKF